MDIRDAIRRALATKILTRCERCPWELVRAAHNYEPLVIRYGSKWVRQEFDAVLEKYADRLPEWLED